MSDSRAVVLPIPGYTGYFADEHGIIWSTHRGRWGNRYDDPHPLKTRPDKDGYACVRLVTSERRVRNNRVHVLVALAFLGPRPAGLVVCHRNGDCNDNSYGNLLYATHAQNIADRDAHGRTVRGERSHLSKLTEDQAREILRRVGEGESQASLAREFGVQVSTIWGLKTGRTWRHLAAVS